MILINEGDSVLLYENGKGKRCVVRQIIGNENVLLRRVPRADSNDFVSNVQYIMKNYTTGEVELSTIDKQKEVKKNGAGYRFKKKK